MALRSIDQRFWTDPYVESLSATEKLVYIHLFSSAHTNLVGVFQASRRMIAFQTACPEPAVEAALERFRRDGKALIDGSEVWLASYIRHQCTSSPKMLAAMRGQLAKVESDAIRKAILGRYPHIMEAPGPRPPVQRCLLDTVSVLSRYKREEKEKISAGAAPVEGAPVKTPESSPAPLVVSEEVARILKRDFPGVDYAKQLERARIWCAIRGQAIRNVLLFLRKWFANAAKLQRNAQKLALPAQRPCASNMPFKVPTEAELEENRLRGLAMMAHYWGKQQAALT